MENQKQIKIILFRSKTFIPVDASGLAIPGAQAITVGTSDDRKPVAVPEWVKGTPTFALGVQDGSIIEVISPVPVAPAAKQEDAAPEVPPSDEPEPEPELAAAGAKKSKKA